MAGDCNLYDFLGESRVDVLVVVDLIDVVVVGFLSCWIDVFVVMMCLIDFEVLIGVDVAVVNLIEIGVGVLIGVGD